MNVPDLAHDWPRHPDLARKAALVTGGSKAGVTLGITGGRVIL
jgi:hypothetical protein